MKKQTNKNMGVSLTQKQEKRRKGASKMFVSVVLQWKEDHALKLHRYHVRFQRFIRTTATTRRERKTPVSERKIPHTTSDGIIILTPVGFQEVPEPPEDNYESRLFPKFYTDQRPRQPRPGREKPQFSNEIFLIQLVMALK